MLRLRPRLKGVPLTLIGLVLLFFGIWIWIGIRVGIWTYPQYERHIWVVETIPIAHAFWSHQIKAGDSAAELSRDWSPDFVTQFGPWRDMQWFPRGSVFSYIGIDAVAKNDRLVSAAAYSDDGLNDRTFFDTETTNDKAAFSVAQEAYVQRLDAEKDAEYALLVKGLPILKTLGQGDIIPEPMPKP